MSIPSPLALLMGNKARWLVGSMVAATALVGLLAYLDEQRESADALEAFGDEQASLASSVATGLLTRLEYVQRDALQLSDETASLSIFGGRYLGASVRRNSDPPPATIPDGRAIPLTVPLSNGRSIDLLVPTPSLFSGGTRLERPNAVTVLFLVPGSPRFLSTDGRQVDAPRLVEALEQGLTTLDLHRQDAARISLPERLALAGLARVNAGPLGRWGVVVAATAQRERDRESRARGRLVLAVALAGGLVLAFGGIALRQQRKELVLEREIAVREIERDRDERLARVSKAATMMTLASGMAHELSTPLAAIVGRAEQLQSRTADDERASRSVQTILEQADRISQVIRGFLNLARGGEPSLQAADPVSIVRGAAALVEHRFEKRGVALVLKVPEGLPPIRCDVRLLEQALVNLLLNACDACNRGGQVAVETNVEASGVWFSVVDDGAGISPEHAARVMEPFFTTKPAGQGTGLGLAITNEIVKKHRGSLSIVPAQPHGTRATLQIPFTLGETNARA
jgi:two-component system, NtrC family, sensor kinase